MLSIQTTLKLPSLIIYQNLISIVHYLLQNNNRCQNFFHKYELLCSMYSRILQYSLKNTENSVSWKQ